MVITASQVVILMNHAREQATNFNVDLLETDAGQRLAKMIEDEGFTQEQALSMLKEAFGMEKNHAIKAQTTISNQIPAMDKP